MPGASWERAQANLIMAAEMSSSTAENTGIPAQPGYSWPMSSLLHDDDPRREDAQDDLLRESETDVEETVRGRDAERALRDPEERPVDTEADGPDPQG